MEREKGVQRTDPTVLVALQGSEADGQVLHLACQLARERGAKLRALYVVEVPLTLPLALWHEAGEERAREALAAARETALRSGCSLDGTVLPARDIGQAIVDESVERAADVIVLAMPYRSRRGDAASHVLMKALCAVLLWRPSNEARGGSPVSVG